MIRSWSAFACRMAIALACAAAMPVAAAAAPAEVADVIHAEQPFGEGKYKVLIITAYTATLWTDAKAWSMDEPFALTLTYGMRFSTDDIVSRSLGEMKHVDPALNDADLKAYGEMLAKAFPPVKSGDRITALYVPGKATRFFHNGAPTAEIDSGLNSDFFGIWLSPNTSAPSLRAALIHAE
jgi:Chalcone isomerase-like